MAGAAKYQPYPAYQNSYAVWSGDVPEHWTPIRLKHVFSEKKKRLNSSLPAGSISFGNVIFKNEDSLAKETKAAYQEVLAGEFLVNPLNMNFDLLSLRTALSSLDVVVSTGYLVLQSHEGYNKNYLRWLLQQFDVAHMKTLGAGVRQTISFTDIGNSFIFEPPLPEQTKIAAFLDYETGKIDGLIAKQQRLIALLEEKRQAVISHAVTKGLDPTAPLRPSGIDWLGDVPAHWEVSQMKYEAEPGTSITYGIVQAGPHVEDGVPYIKTGDMSGDVLPTFGYSKTSKAIDESYQRSKVAAGDLVIAIRATLGKCLLLPSEIDGANLTQGTAKFSPNEKMLNLYALSYLSCTQVQNYIDSVSKGATFREITLDGLRRIPMLRPPYNEQERIGDHLEKQKERFATLMSNGKAAITLLKERRTALISAAVTGKIDLRGWQAPSDATDTTQDKEVLA